ncbi:hypothetical protein PanWU01x14_171170 [Parasponia andersonii]|uniref:C-JID domain-containing protein n=1 Tax=Parasponia andersonii TaxID=3476 RepID=A0A2P5C9T3_PARAD|nr:hypothetical protein PanWU01x14_171170 [Parasponia andersonii]
MVNAEITIPGRKIPDWFNHHDTKGKISFEVPSQVVGIKTVPIRAVGLCVANNLFPGFFEMALEEGALDSV